MVNYMAILVSGIICMFIGFLWYGPLFGKPWMQMMNFDKKKMDDAKKRGMGKTYFIAFIGTLVMSYILAYLIGYIGLTTFSQGMNLGFLLWLGFFVTKSLGMVLWENKPTKLFFLNILHDLVVLLIVGGILAVWV